MIKFREFTENDWYQYSGAAESNVMPPMIGEFKTANGIIEYDIVYDFEILTVFKHECGKTSHVKLDYSEFISDDEARYKLYESFARNHIEDLIPIFDFEQVA